MGVDLFWSALAVIWIVLTVMTGNGAEALAWLGVLGYASSNYVNRKLEGSKYDY